MQFYALYNDLENFNASSVYSDQAIEKAIAMHEGDSLPGFPSSDVLEYLLAPHYDKLRDPALDCLNNSYDLLEKLSRGIIEKIFKRCPGLGEEIMDIICQIL